MGRALFGDCRGLGSVQTQGWDFIRAVRGSLLSQGPLRPPARGRKANRAWLRGWGGGRGPGPAVEAQQPSFPGAQARAGHSLAASGQVGTLRSALGAAAGG